MNFTKKKRNFLLILISFMVGFIYFIPYIRFVFYDQTLEALQLTNTQLGNLGSIYGITALVCYPIGGYLAQRYSSRILLAISFAGTAAMTFLQSTYPSYSILILIYVLYGVFTTATLWSPYITLLRNLGTEEEQGKLFGFSEAMRGIISTAVGFLFVWIFSLFSTKMGGFKAVLLIGASAYILFSILALFLLPSTNDTGKQKDTGEKAKIIDVLKNPGVWLVGLFLFSCYSSIMAGINYLGTYTTQILGVDSNISSSLAILRSYIIPVVAGIIAGFAADKFKFRTTFLVSLLIMTSAFAIVMPFISKTIGLGIMISIVIALFFFMIKSIYYSVMGEANIPLEITGIASGVIAFIAYIPDAFITSLMGSWLDQNLISGFNKIFIWISVWSCIAIIFAILIHQRYKKIIIIENEDKAEKNYSS